MEFKTEKWDAVFFIIKLPEIKKCMSSVLLLLWVISRIFSGSLIVTVFLGDYLPLLKSVVGLEIYLKAKLQRWCKRMFVVIWGVTGGKES